MRIVVLSSLLLLSMQLYADDDFDRDQIQQRINPVGQVHLEQTAPPAGTVPAAPPTEQGAVKKSPGQATYEQYCVVCHRDGVAGAPKFHEANDWKPRQAKQSIDELVATATKGLNAMPPKGTCQECTAADLKAAIQYMLPPP